METRTGGGRSYLLRCKLRRWSVALSTPILAGSGFIVFFVRAGMGYRPLWPPLRTLVIIYTSSLLAIVAMRIAAWRAESQLRKRLRTCDYRVCINCGYSLNHEQEGRPCPECGTPVDLAEFERAWRKFAWPGLEPPRPSGRP